MASFTMRLHEIVEAGYDIGLEDYPIFDEDYRKPLNQKITDHFWLYEIGYETVQQFGFALRRKMREIMPLYNQRYLSTKLEIDPLNTYSMHEIVTSLGSTDSTSDSESHSDTSSDSDSQARTTNSDTPQTVLMADGDYATAISDAVSKGTSKNDSSAKASQVDKASNANESIRDAKGFQGSQAELLNVYRSTFINVDMEIIAELNALFMQLYDTNETMSGYQGDPNSMMGYAGFMAPNIPYAGYGYM